MRNSFALVIFEFLPNKHFTLLQNIASSTIFSIMGKKEDGEGLVNCPFFFRPSTTLCVLLNHPPSHHRVLDNLQTIQSKKDCQCGGDQYVDHQSPISEFLSVFHTKFLIYFWVYLGKSHSVLLEFLGSHIPNLQIF